MERLLRIASRRRAITPAVRQLGCRSFKKAATVPEKKEGKTGGRDPYALLKAAIAAEPDAEKMQALSAEKPTDSVRRARLAEYSRQAMSEVPAKRLRQLSALRTHRPDC